MNSFSRVYRENGMRLRVWSALFAAVFTMYTAGIVGHASILRSPVTMSFIAQISPGDNDGDGLPDDFDPDDDNDGVIDQADPAPFDASLPGTNVPQIPVPHEQDSDGDGIADDIDPDDDNNGVLDNAYPPPTVPLKPTTEPAPVPADRSQVPPVVTALPATGSGDKNSPPLVPIILIANLTLLIASFRVVKASSSK